MGTNELEERMLTSTLTAFTAGGEVSAQEGTLLIDGWLQALNGDAGSERVAARLQELQRVLQSSNPSAEHVRNLLMDLSDKAAAAAQGRYAEGTWTGKLQGLSVALRDFANQL